MREKSGPARRRGSSPWGQPKRQRNRSDLPSPETSTPFITANVAWLQLPGGPGIVCEFAKPEPGAPPLLSHLLFAVLEGTPQPPAVPRAHPDCSHADTPMNAVTRPVTRDPGWAHVTSMLTTEVERNGFLSEGSWELITSTWERQW